MTLGDPGAPAAFRRAIEDAATILVGAEPIPDGDAFGAELTVRGLIARAYGLATRPEDARPGKGPKWVAILNEGVAAPRYSFLDDAGEARAPSVEDRERVFDLAIVVDGGVERMGPVVSQIFERARSRVYVDHHRQGSRKSYDVVLLDPESASTTELLATLLEDPAWSDVSLDRALAEAIYVGIASDTGSFVYSLTSPRTHRVAARLLEAGARTSLIGERVLLETRFEDLVLKGKVLERARLVMNGRVVVSELLLEMVEGNGRGGRDVGYDKVVTTLAFVTGVSVTVLLREVDAATWKLSFRSRGTVNVADLARELDPEGGGHARAAGCTLRGPLDQVRARVLAAVERRLCSAT